MLNGKFTRKAVAATFLLILVTNTIAPTITYALTGGPTSPDATSFEPVDTTDLVNLQSGNFTYNIPLIDVPSPEGDYPLALSYHSGIQPDQEASWVGLGWSLNPGAINRFVNGYPDDWNSTQTIDHQYWAGGSTSVSSFGYTYGIDGIASANFDLSFGKDTYQGCGVGFQMGLQVGSANVSVGVSPFGETYANASTQLLGISYDGMSVGLDVSTDFNSVSVGFQTPAGSTGMNLSSGANYYSSAGSNELNSQKGKISTQTKNAAGQIGFLNFGFFNEHYWMDDNISTTAHGTLYSNSWKIGRAFQIIGSGLLDDQYRDAFDTYGILEDASFGDGKANISQYPDPSTQQGGAFYDFDEYNVTAQGVGGNMRPYALQAQVLNRGTSPVTSLPILTYFPNYYNNDAYFNNPTPQFRFIGDYSNSYRQNVSSYTAGQDPESVAPPFDETPTYGNNDGNKGYDPYMNKLTGSRRINFYTNQQILNGQCGNFIQPSNCPGFTRQSTTTIAVDPTTNLTVNNTPYGTTISGSNTATDYSYANGIGGFSITNESGVTYHYGLPAYTSGEEVYSQQVSTQGGLYFNRQVKQAPYAYTWYLTSVTGPDYVDRNGNGIADAGDWGYWVNFEYGKWAELTNTTSNTFAWRTPFQGANRDNDNHWENISMGWKEVYYLNAIRTRTHIALFEKQVREDGQSAGPEVFTKNYDPVNSTPYHTVYKDYTYPQGSTMLSNPSLALSHIYLLNISDANLVTTSTGSLPISMLHTNVLDNADIDAAGRSLIESKAIRVIDFNYDYSLCPGTANSSAGKLTLNSVNIRGKGGVSLIPPISFDYDLTGPDIQTANVSIVGTATNNYFVADNWQLNVGDLVTQNGNFLGVITAAEDMSTHWSPIPYTGYWLANGNALPVVGSVSTTKNPPYNPDAHDSWGMYKSDYSPSLIGDGNQDLGNQNLLRATSSISSKSTDVWSLRKIHTSLGAEVVINYEGDVINPYKNYYSPTSIIATPTGSSIANAVSVDPYTVTTIGKNTFTTYTGASLSANFTFNMLTGNIHSINEYFQVGQSVNAIIAMTYSAYNYPDRTTIGGTVYATTTLTIGSILNDASTNTQNISASINNLQLLSWNGTSFVPASFGGIAPVTFTLLTANIFMNEPAIIYGGGVRVKNISLRNGGETNITSYNYVDPRTGIESGVTSQYPYALESASNNPYVNLDPGAYTFLLYQNMSPNSSLSSELPGPGVIHEYVTVTSQVQNSDEPLVRNITGSTQYKFGVFRNNMLGRVIYTNSGGQVNMALINATEGIGTVKRITELDKDGNKLTETVNHYLDDGLENLSLSDYANSYKSILEQSQYNYQGYIQERFSEVKQLSNQPLANNNGTFATMCTKEEFPCVNTGQTITNYVNGTQTGTQIIGHDYYSGEVTKKVETDAYGNRFMTQTVPAYNIYTGMGLSMIEESINPTGNPVCKNMLSQIAETYTYKVDINNSPIGLVSADITTWGNNSPIDIDGSFPSGDGNIWRKQSAYVWMPIPGIQGTDGTTPIVNFSDFNWNSYPSSAASWKKTSQTTLYDVYSHALEGTDINNNYSAIKMDNGQERVVLTGTNANYSEMAFSGAEDANGSQSNNSFVHNGDGVISSDYAHTGTQSLLLGASAGNRGFVYSVPTSNLTPGRNYIASVWVKPSIGAQSTVNLCYDINGVVKGTSIASGSSTKVAGGWYLINLNINGSDIIAGNTLDVYCINNDPSIPAYVDDMRFQPSNAQTTAYVYDPFSGELKYVLNNNDLYTRYDYDAMGRLSAIYKEKIGVGTYETNSYQYNYQQ
jgi:hypothetical protein